MTANQKGSGNTFAEFELSDGSTVEVRDDGAADWDVVLEVSWSGGASAANICAVLSRFRGYMGDDDAFADLFDGVGAEAGGGSEGAGSPVEQVTRTRGPFVCDDCHRTWPSKDNQNHGTGPDLCPECDDG